MVRRSGLWCLCVALWAAGCGEPDALPPCGSSDDCKASDRCVQGRCVVAGGVDSGRVDADGAAFDAQPPPVDAHVPPVDAQVPPVDAQVPVDAQSPPVDAQGPPVDAEVAPAPDAAIPTPDATTPLDAAAAADADRPIPDASAPDAAVSPDSAVLDASLAPVEDAAPPDAQADAAADAATHEEICNNADDDGDHAVDEGPDGLPLRRDCFDGPEGTLDVGLCHAGTQTCTGGQWSECVGQVVPHAELCDDDDWDCDGDPHDGYDLDGHAVGTSCGLRGACAEGLVECSFDGDAAQCSAEPGVETCNDVDDDCDGETDEDDDLCPAGQACDGGSCVCVPDCGPRACGDDGCGGSCGDCDAGQTCGADGQCEVVVPDSFVLIQPGEFWMGSPPAELGRSGNETYHLVRLTRPFLMKTTEVTQAEWRALMPNNPSSFVACGDDCPVETVNWFEAAAYCNALSQAQGLLACYTLADCIRAPGDDMECSQVSSVGPDCEGYRLPTEAEWEYAARAGTETAYYSGANSQTQCGLDPNLDAVGWYCGNANNTTHPAASKLPNAWGLSDMLGNVWEWTDDWYASDYGGFGDAAVPVVDPVGPPAAGARVDRGGSWTSGAQYARAAFRDYFSPGSRYGNLGFRVARSVP